MAADIINFGTRRKTPPPPSPARTNTPARRKTPPPPTLDDIKLERRFNRLARKLKRARGNSNVADLQTLRALLTLTIELIPMARATYRQYRSERAIYAMNGLVNQARELMNDIRQLRTGKKQHQHIVNKILLPNLQAILQQYLNDCTEFKKGLSQLRRQDRSRVEKAINAMMQAHARVFNEISQRTQTNLADYLIG
jgi:hypothetical protein